MGRTAVMLRIEESERVQLYHLSLGLKPVRLNAESRNVRFALRAAESL